MTTKRSQLEEFVWRDTPADFRTTRGGKRWILGLHYSGFHWTRLDEFSDEGLRYELMGRAPSEVRALADYRKTFGREPPLPREPPATENPLVHSSRPTARQAEKERKKLSKEIDAAASDKARAKLAELRRAVREAKKSPKMQRADAVAQCKAAREAHRERAKALRVEARSTVSDAIQADRVALRTACAERKREITAKGASELETARRLLAEERRLVRELAALERSSRSRERARPRASAAERVAESDDRVRSNIPPDLAALFEKVKRRIFETDRESRTEAFLRYAEEHPDEVVRSQEAAADREIARLVAEQSAHEAEMAREGVPF